ncbi:MULTISPECIES: hypothetical protein [unclassified Cryobacterium]|nr:MULTISPECIES: hypothetical protein [unclassified Cryobacterium]
MDSFQVTAQVVPVPGPNDVEQLGRVAFSVARIHGEFFDSNIIMGIA